MVKLFWLTTTLFKKIFGQKSFFGQNKFDKNDFGQNKFWVEKRKIVLINFGEKMSGHRSFLSKKISGTVTQ